MVLNVNPINIFTPLVPSERKLAIGTIKLMLDRCKAAYEILTNGIFDVAKWMDAWTAVEEAIKETDK